MGLDRQVAATTTTSVGAAGSIARPFDFGRCVSTTGGATIGGATAVRMARSFRPEHLALHHHEDAEADERPRDPEPGAGGADADAEALDQPGTAAVERLEGERPAGREVVRDLAEDRARRGQSGRDVGGASDAAAAWAATTAVSVNRTSALPGSTTRTTNPPSGETGITSPILSFCQPGTIAVALPPFMSIRS